MSINLLIQSFVASRTEKNMHAHTTLANIRFLIWRTTDLFTNLKELPAILRKIGSGFQTLVMNKNIWNYTTRQKKLQKMKYFSYFAPIE